MTRKTKMIAAMVLGVLVLAGIVVGVFTVSKNYLSRKEQKADRACDSAQHVDYRVAIQDGKAVPEDTQAKRCDTLTIVNQDNRIRLMAFGVHEDHVIYDGIEEKVLKESESFTVTLVQVGNFKFHDHVDDLAQGTFTVTDDAQ